jgi:CHAD domain-containing protein
LGSITNRVRDLDVYLLQQEVYKAKLSAPYRDAIDPLFAMLQQERAKAHTALVRQLRTKKYQNMLDQWETFLATPCDAVADAAPAAARPILQVARQRIKKKARTIVTLGTALRHSNDGQGLHALRIECKKLRYLFEFFESLLPAQEVALVVKQLRKLQDNLGDFHDICVQQADLQTFAARFATSQHHGPDLLLAIEGLIEILEAEKATVRKAFPKLFTAFVKAYREVTL